MTDPRIRPRNQRESGTEPSPAMALYETMATIRAVESLLLESFGTGLLRGTTHTSLGQEAIAASALSFLKTDDIVVSNHRSHGHYLAYGGGLKELFAEIAGLPGGVCKGLGGSQHLQVRNFYSNGVLGGTVPVATGMALAERLKGSKAVAVCFLGDGALGEGAVYESLNIASLWSAPILYVVEDNRYAQSTPVEKNLAGSMAKRFEAFGIGCSEIESNDIDELLPAFEKAFAAVRRCGRPFCQIVHTYRLGPHSKGDDTRDPEEIRRWESKDPLRIAEARLPPGAAAAARLRIEAEARAALDAVLKEHRLGAEPVLPRGDDALIPTDFEPDPAWAAESGLMVAHLNAALGEAFADDPRVHLIGEDILDPYGGAFKVSKGLSTKFPTRVHSSPVSEAGIMGVANGMALRGLKPIVELMFGDFSALALDQVLNHCAKFSRMYAGQAACPVIVRAPMGGYRGYGPTHSQSLEKLFLGVPGLSVVACDPLRDQRIIWKRMLDLGGPCVYVENKALYGQPLKTFSDGRIDDFFARASRGYFPTAELQLAPFDRAPDACLFAYGGMTPLAMTAARSLFIDDELLVRVIVPAQLAPVPSADLSAAAGALRAIVTLEEGTLRGGWGAEIAATLGRRVWRVAARDTIIPSSRLGEAAVLPDEERVRAAIRESIAA